MSASAEVCRGTMTQRQEHNDAKSTQFGSTIGCAYLVNIFCFAYVFAAKAKANTNTNWTNSDEFIKNIYVLTRIWKTQTDYG
mgnify:CR=1 FL=1